jgi:DNA-binding NarL/FixJ family response regulator
MHFPPVHFTQVRVSLLQLTPAERKVLYFMHDGLDYAEIAKRLSIAAVTVRSHVHNISGKLGISRQQWMRLRLPKNKRDSGG